MTHPFQIPVSEGTLNELCDTSFKTKAMECYKRPTHECVSAEVPWFNYHRASERLVLIQEVLSSLVRRGTVGNPYKLIALNTVYRNTLRH